MTLKMAQAAARTVDMTIKKVDGEYRVAPLGTRGDEQTYFTNDLSDALHTAYAMAANNG